ncbi:MAG: cyclic nucleotide-binding domain-containing protein, partial [Anaerolineae bacterium]|nr:cyclic nucleotide-binding domain-containing protein [Anaerolineae bacterium]
MANRFVLTHIRNLPLLSKVPPTLLEWMAEIVEIIQLQPQQLVFRQGQPGQGLFLLVNGHAVLVSGSAPNERIVGEVHENQFVGESALFGNTTERMSMRVTQPSVLLFLPHLKFQQALLDHPEIRPYLTSQMVRFDADAPPAFPGARPGEHLLLREHRHIWAFIRNAIMPVSIGIVLVIIAVLLVQTGLALVFAALALVIPGAWIYYAYVEWQNDYLIITDQRIIYYTRTIISLQNQTREIVVSSVHEVSYTIPPSDPFARLFRYGSVFIKTAGDAGNVELTVMPNPEQIQRVIITDLQNYKKVQEQQNREAISEVIDRFLSPEDARTQQQLPKDKAAVQAQSPGLLGTRYVDAQNNITYRKHASVWFAHILFPSLFVLAGAVLFVVTLILPSAAVHTAGFVLGPFVVLLGVVWFYWSDWDWRHDMLILGASTIRIIHRRPLWLQDMSEEVLLSQVDDVVIIRNGLLNTLLNRGNLSLSLIGDDKPKRFENVGSPEHIKNDVFERRAALQRSEQEGTLLRQREEIARYLDVYHDRMQAQPPQVSG